MKYVKMTEEQKMKKSIDRLFAKMQIKEAQKLSLKCAKCNSRRTITHNFINKVECLSCGNYWENN